MPGCGVGIYPTAPASRSPSIYEGKEPIDTAPVTHQFISDQALSNALDEALKTSSSETEKAPIASERESISEEYPSAPNGESLTASVRSRGNPIKVFSNGLTEKFEILTNREKFKSQAQLTFPITYAFVEKLVNKQEHKLKDAFAVFDGILSYLK